MCSVRIVISASLYPVIFRHLFKMSMQYGTQTVLCKSYGFIADTGCTLSRFIYISFHIYIYVLTR